MIPGFADPVMDAQAAFRAVLDAMARPGRVHVLRSTFSPPAPLGGALATLLLTLADADTPLWLATELAPARAWIDFHCGAPIDADPGHAAFGVAGTLPDLDLFDAGSDIAPERSATLLVAVRDFSAGRRFCFSGPGLRAPQIVAIDGLPDDFAALWHANRARFPRGLDLILCAGDAVMALPRSLTVADA